MDVGCRHSNSLRVDPEQTFLSLNLFHKNHKELLKAEQKWLTENKISLIISDAASLPLMAAGQLKIPSLLIANFTWHDIYSHLPGVKNESHIIEALEEEYSHASLQILPQCHLQNNIVLNKKEVGFIANKGRNIRNELERFLGKIFKDKILVFIYLGEHGTRSVIWENLKENKDCIFLTRDPIKSSVMHILDEKFSYHDLIASSDIILTKGGYSTLATAFNNHKPIVTCERDDFYEFEAIREYLQSRQIGAIVKNTPFYQGDWQEAIKKALKLTVKNKVPLNGEVETAAIVHQMLS